MARKQDHGDADISVRLEAIRQRASELEAEIEADRARFAAEIARTQAKLDRMNRRFAPLRGFGVTHQKPRIPGWLAALFIALFIGSLIWAALQTT